MTGEKGKQYLKDYLASTDQHFTDYLQNEVLKAAEISKIPAELLKRFAETARKGKKIRGALVQLGYELGGGTNISAIQDVGLAVELFHAAVLVHDDVMDQDDLRRGLPSLHKQYAEIGQALKVGMDINHFGESMAINIGDAVFYLSFEKLLSAPFPPAILVAAGKIYAEYVVRVAYGQMLDITNVSLQTMSEKDVLAVLKYKTAEYTGVMPLLLGAAFAGVNDSKKLKAMYEYGVGLGWAFQIQDDILGLYGKEEEFGKPIGSDVREGKNTLLMLELFRMGTEDDRAFMRRVLGNKATIVEEVLQLRERVKKSGAYQKVYDLGISYTKAGIAQIPAMTSDNRLAEVLESLITYMMERVV